MDMDLSLLVNYGVLGLWTLYLIYEKQKLVEHLGKMSDALDKNTDVLDKISYIIESKAGGIK